MGIPWLSRGRDRLGLDCYGLVALVYLERLDIALPSYADAYACALERGEVAALLAGAAAAPPWRAIEPEAAHPHDVLLFRAGRLESHVGVVVTPGRMLHCAEGTLSCIESYTCGRWRPRLMGVYRHADAPR